MKINLSRFFQSPVNIFIFKNLGPATARWYIQALGVLYYLFNRKEKRIIETNIRDCLAGRGERHIRRVIRRTFRGIFTHYFEKIFSAFLSYDTVQDYVKRHSRIEGSELLDRGLAQGRGVILVTAHWGAVEFIPWVLFRAGYKVSVILECQTEQLARALQDRIKDRDMELISSCFGMSVFFKALGALKRNRILVTQCDEVDAWRRKPGQTITLFGKELYFDDTIDVIARRSLSPVVGAFLKRTDAGSYTLLCEDVSVDARPESTARGALQLWQKHVNENPEQWYQWKKWRKMKTA